MFVIYCRIPILISFKICKCLKTNDIILVCIAKYRWTSFHTFSLLIYHSTFQGQHTVHLHVLTFCWFSGNVFWTLVGHPDITTSKAHQFLLVLEVNAVKSCRSFSFSCLCIGVASQQYLKLVFPFHEISVDPWELSGSKNGLQIVITFIQHFVLHPVCDICR